MSPMRLLALAIVANVALITATPAMAFDPFKSKNAKVKKGNKQYEADKFADALESYDKAALQLPDEAGVHFNRGDALFKQAMGGDGADQAALDRSAKAFNDAIGLAGEEQSDLKADAFFNIGNVRFAQERWEEAIAAYRQALKLRPGFEDAAFNLALALKKLEEQKKKEEEEKKKQEQEQQEKQEQQEQQDEQQDDEQCDSGQEQGDQGEKQEQKQDQQGEQGQEQEQKQDQQGDQGQEQEQKQDQQGDQAGNQQQPQPEKQETMQEPVAVTEQEAEAILDALQRGEKNLKLEELREAGGQGYGKPEVDKDW